MFRRWRSRLDGLLREYGPVALGVWLALSALTWIGVALAIASGFEVGGVADGALTLVGTWAATRVTLPARVAATAALTPVVARVLGRRPPEPSPVPISAGGPEEG